MSPILPIPTIALELNPELGSKSYKFWVECLGNNHMLVKAILKRRNWLNFVEVSQEGSWLQATPQSVSVIWTQVRHRRIMQDI